jgi:LysR family transcriptional regulator, cyn operon transcriptional activator
MDLVLLRSLLAVADAGTITDAAARVNISQSALSRRLQQIEADLGAELLVRGRHGVELTDIGRQTIDQARGIVARYDRLRQDISAQLGLERGTVRVGGGATVTSYLLPPRIADFQAAHPGIRFYVKEAGSREIAADVSAGELELGVVTLPVPSRDLDITELAIDEIVLVARADHPFATRRVQVTELDGQPFVAFESGSAIRQIIDATLRAAGVEMDIVMELRSIPSILRMVATTGHVAFVSRVSLPAEPSLRAISVRGLTISRALGLATRSGIPLSAPAGAFVALLRGSA